MSEGDGTDGSSDADDDSGPSGQPCGETAPHDGPPSKVRILYGESAVDPNRLFNEGWGEMFVVDVVGHEVGEPRQVTPPTTANAHYEYELELIADRWQVIRYVDQSQPEERLFVLDMLAPSHDQSSLMAVEGLEGAREIHVRGVSPDETHLLLAADFGEGAPGGLFTVVFDESEPPRAARVHELSPLGPGGSRSLWAPSGRAFVYTVEEEGGLYQVYVQSELDTPSAAGLPITAHTDPDVFPANYLWHPDEAWVFWTADDDADNKQEVFVAPVDGTGAPQRFDASDTQRVTLLGADPLGRGVVFSLAEAAGDAAELWFLPFADGSFGAPSLIDADAGVSFGDERPPWTPDGRWFLYQAPGNGDWIQRGQPMLAKVEANGEPTDAVPLAEDVFAGNQVVPMLSPTGSSVIALSRDLNSGSLYRVALDPGGAGPALHLGDAERDYRSISPFDDEWAEIRDGIPGQAGGGEISVVAYDDGELECVLRRPMEDEHGIGLVERLDGDLRWLFSYSTLNEADRSASRSIRAIRDDDTDGWGYEIVSGMHGAGPRVVSLPE